VKTRLVVGELEIELVGRGDVPEQCDVLPVTGEATFLLFRVELLEKLPVDGMSVEQRIGVASVVEDGLCVDA
jgi:hypothetical protein